jgi:sugar/nucleoside kinase (ribokinase family)
LRELELVSGVNEPIQALHRLRKLGVKIAAATLGDEGSLVADADSIIHAPCYSANVVDETGAGDAYLVGFFSEYIRSGETDVAAAMGSACASAIVETVGPDVSVDKGELHARAEDVRERIKRV